jgi:hypothetical protein
LIGLVAAFALYLEERRALYELQREQQDREIEREDGAAGANGTQSGMPLT